MMEHQNRLDFGDWVESAFKRLPDVKERSFLDALIRIAESRQIKPASIQASLAEIGDFMRLGKGKGEQTARRAAKFWESLGVISRQVTPGKRPKWVIEWGKILSDRPPWDDPAAETPADEAIDVQDVTPDISSNQVGPVLDPNEFLRIADELEALTARSMSLLRQLRAAGYRRAAEMSGVSHENVTPDIFEVEMLGVTKTPVGHEENVRGDTQKMSPLTFSSSPSESTPSSGSTRGRAEDFAGNVTPDIFVTPDKPPHGEVPRDMTWKNVNVMSCHQTKNLRWPKKWYPIAKATLNSNALAEMFDFVVESGGCGWTADEREQFYALALYCTRVGKIPGKLFHSGVQNHETGWAEAPDRKFAAAAMRRHHPELTAAAAADP